MLPSSSMCGKDLKNNYRAVSEKNIGKQYQSKKFVLKLDTVKTSRASVAPNNNFKTQLDTIF